MNTIKQLVSILSIILVALGIAGCGQMALLQTTDEKASVKEHIENEAEIGEQEQSSDMTSVNPEIEADGESASVKDILAGEEMVPSFDTRFQSIYRFYNIITDEFDEELMNYTSDIIIGDMVSSDTLEMTVQYRTNDEAAVLLAEHTYEMVYNIAEDLFDLTLMAYKQSHDLCDPIELLAISINEDGSLHCKYGIRRGMTLSTGYNYYMDHYDLAYYGLE